jgi:hypothetical protein
MKSSTGDNAKVIRWRTIHPESMPRVSKRLYSIQKKPPSGVAPLLRFGFAGLTRSKVLLRMERQWVPGVPLAALASQINVLEYQALANTLMFHVIQWQSEGFVHGDLSPSNILVDRKPDQPPSISFIDWVVDLASYEATPKYAAPSVFDGNRDFESDLYSLDVILKFLRSAVV